MSSTVAGLLQVGLLIAALAAVYKPFGDYMARVYTAARQDRAQPRRRPAWHHHAHEHHPTPMSG